METAGTRHWAVERVPPGAGRNISNGLSIRTGTASPPRCCSAAALVAALLLTAAGVESCSAGLKELCVAKARASPLPLLTAALHAAPLARRLPCPPRGGGTARAPSTGSGASARVGRAGREARSLSLGQPLSASTSRRGREGAREARRARARAGGRRPPRRRRGPRVGRLARCRRRGGLAGLDGGRVARRGERCGAVGRFWGRVKYPLPSPRPDSNALSGICFRSTHGFMSTGSQISWRPPRDRLGLSDGTARRGCSELPCL